MLSIMLTTIVNAHRNSDDEAELMRRIKARDTDALVELYDLYNRLLFGMILSIVKKREEAEALLQEVFIMIWSKAESFNEGRDNVYSWIVALTRNKAIAHVRPNEEQAQSAFNSLIAWSEGDHQDLMGTTIFSDRAELVKKALDEMPKKQSEIIQIAFYRGLKQSQIANYLDIPVGTVKSQTRKAMINLKRILGEFISTDG